ncbi:MAG: GMC family oxidoreductase N-terminal domain-containing protein [Deltaproteobacteria bacterium]|nr:GMC family oxidoreductase N-terminal domain-containing protein [Myxococcales bacterium]MDP3217242.1 GMC family oxidoreductase N-terminal domain-containing protein [Deltaproteobacteria bacterium]
MVEGFDTVVVGAGAAGAVIAARMTERGDRQVLLLEAGPDYATPESLPQDLRDGTRNSLVAHDWGYTHSPNARQVRFPMPRGKVVGGSSAVNTCIGLRGVPSDYDEWAARGLAPWSWAQCLPAFKRLETDLDRRDEWHGTDGPVPLRRHTPDELVPWQAAFLEAAAAIGMPRCDDTNHPEAKGYGPHAMNKIDGERMSAARCYLTPEVRRRANLTLRARTLVRRVVFRQRRAVGVEVESASGRVYTIAAKRVVLCAGALATPGVLLRSGVGPRAELDRLGVAVVSEVGAVARRLLDHPGAAFFLWPKKGVCDLLHPLIQTTLRLRSKDGEHENDLQLQAGSAVLMPTMNLPLVSIMCQVGKPAGYGLIRYPSADVRARPEIRSRLLDHPTDRARALEALEIGRAMAETPVMRDLARVVWPPPGVLASERFSRWIWAFCDSGYHPCGTVPMGADDDPDAATDAYGRVRGTEGLLVADASLMPTVPTANTHLPTLMIGERFGEWLRDGVV